MREKGASNHVDAQTRLLDSLNRELGSDGRGRCFRLGPPVFSGSALQTLKSEYKSLQTGIRTPWRLCYQNLLTAFSHLSLQKVRVMLLGDSETGLEKAI
jgi:hypothetical protein